MVAATPKHSDCLQKKKNELEHIEHKLDAGLDRTLNSIVGWVKTILQQEQKKSDFNPTGSASGAPLATASPACVRVAEQAIQLPTHTAIVDASDSSDDATDAKVCI